MSTYRLVFSRSAKKDIDEIDRINRQRIAKKLLYFLEQDDPLTYARRLVHLSIGSYRFRVGHYRIVFDVNGHDIEVTSVKHRKDVYRS